MDRIVLYMIEVSYRPTGLKEVELKLPLSKSLSNRYLIIKALYPDEIEIENYSDSADTFLLQSALYESSESIDFGIAGTSARFFLAYATIKGINTRIDASGRGRERPIEPLFDALKGLGGEWIFEGEINQFPCRIVNPPLDGGSTKLSVGSSSQFATALMLMGSSMKNGLKVRFDGKQTSLDYLKMTASILLDLGVEVNLNEKGFTVLPKPKLDRVHSISIEADWSAAAYVAQHIVSKKEDCRIQLRNLRLESLQADSVLIEYFRDLGLKVMTMDNGIEMYYNDKQVNKEVICDFSSCPDLSIAFASSLSVSPVSGRLIGLHTLPSKESNRWKGLIDNLGILVNVSFDLQKWSMDIGQQKEYRKYIDWNTLVDHRFVMSGSVLANTKQKVRLSEIDSVEKSFPDFVIEMEKLGYSFKADK